MEDNLNLHMKDNVLKCCLTIDGWTSSSQESFMGITCHYIDENFATKSVVLNLKHLNENHNAEYIKDTVNKVLDEWKLKDKVKTRLLMLMIIL